MAKDVKIISHLKIWLLVSYISPYYHLNTDYQKFAIHLASSAIQPLSQTAGAGPSRIPLTPVSQPRSLSQIIGESTIPFPRTPHGGRKVMY